MYLSLISGEQRLTDSLTVETVTSIYPNYTDKLPMSLTEENIL